jgi:DUF177 domain-containing protein
MSVRFVIDSLDFVRNVQTHHGKIPLAGLLRLQDFLFENTGTTGTLSYQISGKHDARGKPNLTIRVEGEIYLCCQRCLGRLRHTLDLRTSLLLAKNESELNQADKDDSIDAILATSDLDVLNLIEDEVILSLSMSSRHLEGECEIHNKPAEQENRNAANKENPFSALAALKKTH